MSDETRIQPHDAEAERGLLGAILLNNSVVDDVLDEVSADDFYSPRHRVLFASIVEMRATGQPIDAITLRSNLAAKEKLEQVGGAAYLLDLSSSCQTSTNAVHYAKIVRDLHKMRQLIIIGGNMSTLGYTSQVDDIDETINDAMSQITSLALSHQSTAVPVGVVLSDVMKEMYGGRRNYFHPPKMPAARFRPGDLVVVAAGTSVGKTAVTLDWADEWSKEKQVTYFEYEMPETDLMARLICKHAGVTMAQIQDGNLSPEEVDRIEDAAERLKHRKLKVAEVWCNNTTLFARIRREAQQGSEIVVVDHLGLVPIANRGKGMNEAKAIGTFVTNPLKRLAAELGITIVLLVQLNREGQRDGYPRLYHLRDSGEIEQDASVVITLWSEASIKDEWATRIKLREESGLVAPDDVQDESFLLVRYCVEKNRNGEKGVVVWAKFNGAHFTYTFKQDEEVELIDRPLFAEVKK